MSSMSRKYINTLGNNFVNADNRSNFFLAVQPWLPSVRSFWRAVQPFSTILSKFYSCRSAVQVYRSKIFFAVQTWLPSVRNFSLAVQPSYQSVRNKLLAVQPFGFIRFKRLRGPFLTRSTAVRFTLFNGKPLVYVFSWEVTLIIVFECRSFAADLPLDKLQKFYNNFIMAVSNWTGHERVSFFRHAEYKQTCPRKKKKKRAIKRFDAFK